ncbi:hypothetical protein BDW22DRAFT_1355900 [Trametopsis cervina]|nr:hypothetical protein BDW22DRAFT_1355900 [Trametopsis cervina]
MALSLSTLIWFGKHEGKPFDSPDVPDQWRHWARYGEGVEHYSWHEKYCQIYAHWQSERIKAPGAKSPGDERLWFGQKIRGMPWSQAWEKIELRDWLFDPQRRRWHWYTGICDLRDRYIMWLENHHDERRTSLSPEADVTGGVDDLRNPMDDEDDEERTDENIDGNGLAQAMEDKSSLATEQEDVNLHCGGVDADAGPSDPTLRGSQSRVSRQSSPVSSDEMYDFVVPDVEMEDGDGSYQPSQVSQVDWPEVPTRRSVRLSNKQHLASARRVSASSSAATSESDREDDIPTGMPLAGRKRAHSTDDEDSSDETTHRPRLRRTGGIKTILSPSQ